MPMFISSRIKLSVLTSGFLTLVLYILIYEYKIVKNINILVKIFSLKINHKQNSIKSDGRISPKAVESEYSK